MKRGYTYRIEVHPVPDETGAAPSPPLVFTHHNHDDLMAVVEKTGQASGLDPASAAATALGLKLLGSVMLSEKGNPLFDCLRAPLHEFIVGLKARASKQ